MSQYQKNIDERVALAMVNAKLKPRSGAVGHPTRRDEVERIEIEDDRRCAECDSTEGGNCFYCQDGLG